MQKTLRTTERSETRREDTDLRSTCPSGIICMQQFLPHTLAAALFLVALLVPAATNAQPSPPSEKQLLKADTVDVFSSPDKWTTRYYNTEVTPNPWMEVSDPYGGQIHIPSMYYLFIASDVTAFIEDTQLKSVFFVPRELLIPVALMIFVGLITLVAFPFARYRKRLLRERERRERTDEIRHHLAEGREAERLRLARDLHDGPVQDLHALRMRLSILARQVAGKRTSSQNPATAGAKDDASGAIEEMVEEMQRVIRDLRGVSENLRPPSLGPFGLAAALRAFAERYRRTYPSIRVNLDLEQDGQELPQSVRLALFRIVQEAMNNAAKHANPHTVTVVLRLSAEQILLSVTDDGCGYHVPDDFRHLGQEGHYGLLGMSERAESIGAELHIESHPDEDKPTRVKVRADRKPAKRPFSGFLKK